MTLTRLPQWMLMPEIPDPGTAPPDYAHFFTRDDTGVTKISYHTSTGPLVDVDTPPIGPGSGGEFINVQRDYGVDGSGNDYAGMLAALGDAKSGDTVWCAGLNIQINTSLSIPAGVHLKGTRLTGEGSYARLYAGASMTNLVTLHDGSSVEGFTLDSNGFAQHSAYVDGNGATVANNKIYAGSQYSVRNNATGADRFTLSHNRVEGNGAPNQAIIGIFGKRNTVDSNVATGAHSGTPPVLAACDESSFYGGHYTGNSGSADCLRVTGDYNSFTVVVGDTCANPADACLGIRGNFNTFFACGMMNVATGASVPLVAFRPSIGNQIYGLFYVSGGQSGTCGPAVQFLDNSGGVLTNTAGNRALFPGTRVYWSGANMTQVAGQWSNFQPTSGDAIDLVGAAGSGQSFRT